MKPLHHLLLALFAPSADAVRLLRKPHLRAGAIASNQWLEPKLAFKMKTKLTSLITIVLLGPGILIAQAQVATEACVQRSDPSGSKSASPPPAISWSEIGAKAGADYKGDGLSVAPTADGGRLRCVFQRMEGEATREGLWITSTATAKVNDCFQVKAAAVGHGSQNQTSNTQLDARGNVSLDGQTVRFTRPGLVEEYSASMDGVRQDFVVFEKPVTPINYQPSTLNSQELRLELSVSGARVEPVAYGVQLVLENSGRKIAYSRLRVTDATGRELAARFELAATRQCAAEIEEDDGGGLPTRRYAELVILVNDDHATYPIRIDPTFSDANWVSMNPSFPGAAGPVYAAVVDGAGDLYVGGAFTAVGDVLANGIAKWNGSGWSALGSGVDSSVRALAVSGSDVYAGGQFTTAGGGAASRVAKWNGSSWSALGPGLNNTVQALAVTGSNVYAGGEFTYTGGGLSPASRIAKWDGSSWSALGAGMDNDVRALAVLSGKLYAGGVFMTVTNAGGIAVPVNCISSWDGTNWTALGEGMNSTVFALAVSSSDLYVGGHFTTVTNTGGVAISASRIAKWDGSSWNSLGSGMSDLVQALAVTGSNLYAGGFFTVAGGNSANRVAKWDGSNWSALGSGLEAGNFVQALAVSGSNVFVGGADDECR